MPNGDAHHSAPRHQKPAPNPRYPGGKEGNGGTASSLGAARLQTVTQGVAAGVHRPHGAHLHPGGASRPGRGAL